MKFDLLYKAYKPDFDIMQDAFDDGKEASSSA